MSWPWGCQRHENEELARMKGGCAHGQRMGMLIRERRRPLQEAMGREAKDPKPPHAGVCGVWGSFWAEEPLVKEDMEGEFGDCVTAGETG